MQFSGLFTVLILRSVAKTHYKNFLTLVLDTLLGYWTRKGGKMLNRIAAFKVGYHAESDPDPTPPNAHERCKNLEIKCEQLQKETMKLWAEVVDLRARLSSKVSYYEFQKLFREAYADDTSIPPKDIGD
jgi:hypothetical protein